MNKRVLSIFLAVVLGVSLSMVGCSEGSWEPSRDQKDAVFRLMGPSIGVKERDVYDETWSISKTSHGCYKATIRYKHDERGNTKTDEFSYYFVDRNSADHCPDSTEHYYDSL